MQNNLLSFKIVHFLEVSCVGNEDFNNSRYKDGGTSFSDKRHTLSFYLYHHLIPELMLHETM